MPDLTRVAEVLARHRLAYHQTATAQNRMTLSRATCKCGYRTDFFNVGVDDSALTAHQAEVLRDAGLLPETTTQTKADALREFAQWAQESDPVEHPFLGLDEVVQTARAYAERIEASE